MLVKEIMSKDIICTDPDEKLGSVAKKMKDRNIGVFPVCRGGKLMGMVTERDIVLRALADSVDPVGMPVRQVMSKEPVSSRESESVKDAFHLMKQKQDRRLPVMDAKDHLVGLRSLGDFAIHASHKLSGEGLEGISLSGKLPASDGLMSKLEQQDFFAGIESS